MRAAYFSWLNDDASSRLTRDLHPMRAVLAFIAFVARKTGRGLLQTLPEFFGAQSGHSESAARLRPSFVIGHNWTVFQAVWVIWKRMRCSSYTRFMLTLMCFPLPHTSPWYTSHPTYLPFEVLSSLTTYPPRIFHLEQTAIDAMHLHRNLAFHTSMYSEGSMYFSGIKVQQVSLHWGTYLNKHPHPLSRSSAW